MPIAQPSADGGVTRIGADVSGSRDAAAIDVRNAAFCASRRARSSGVRLDGFCAPAVATAHASISNTRRMGDGNTGAWGWGLGLGSWGLGVGRGVDYDDGMVMARRMALVLAALLLASAPAAADVRACWPGAAGTRALWAVADVDGDRVVDLVRVSTGSATLVRR